MAFLSEICRGPASERPSILFPVGYAAEATEVPDLTRKPLEETLILMS
ncbi:hypothetical protein [Nonomuraea sp. NPDC050643]